jgi:hypothetical protein|nr:MAG TPA: hypothetical protein [Caudoviricetes sp.]
MTKISKICESAKMVAGLILFFVFAFALAIALQAMLG